MLPPDPYLDIQTADDVRVKGTRVGLEHLLSLYQRGTLAEELAVQFPTVTLEQVHGVLAYYLRNRVAVDEYMKQWREACDEHRALQARQPEPQVVQRLRQVAAHPRTG